MCYEHAGSGVSEMDGTLISVSVGAVFDECLASLFFINSVKILNKNIFKDSLDWRKSNESDITLTKIYIYIYIITKG